MRRVLAAGLAIAALASATAVAGPPLRIISVKVVKAGTRTAAHQPLTRGGRYAYRVDYRVGGRTEVRIARTGTFLSPYGDILEQIEPPSALADPGRLFASGPLHVAAGDSPGEYVLRYAVTASNRSGSTTRNAVLRVRYR
jgi:hypothetical protein